MKHIVEPSETSDIRARRWRWILVYAAGGLTLALVFALAVALVLQLLGMIDAWWGPWRYSITIAAIYAGFLLATTVVVYLRGLLPLMLMSAITTVIALICWLLILWEVPQDWRTEEVLVISAMLLTLITISALHSGGFACLKPRTAGLNGLRMITVVTMWLFTGLVLVAAAVELVLNREPWDWMLYLFSIIGLLSLVLTLVVPLIIRNDAKRWERARESVAERIKVDMTCPKCGERQSIGVGSERCRRCRCVITVELEEPRCECGYLLYRLTSPTCPECGREVPEERRWPPRRVRMLRATWLTPAMMPRRCGRHPEAFADADFAAIAYPLRP